MFRWRRNSKANGRCFLREEEEESLVMFCLLEEILKITTVVYIV